MGKLIQSLILVLLTCLVLGLSAWANGKIVLANDEWTLSDTGFSLAPGAADFALNIASWYMGQGVGNFLVFSSNFGLTGSSLALTMIGAGHTWTVNTALPFDLPTLLGFDGVFLAGKVNGVVPDNNVLIQYVEQGGNVYLAGGTGSSGQFSNASEEAGAWNTFLNHFGLAFDGSGYNIVSGAVSIDNSHPIFVGVNALYQDGGNNLMDLGPTDACAVLVVSNGHGLYAVCDAISPAAIFGCMRLHGAPLRDRKVQLWQKGERRQTTTTDANGCYAFERAVSGETLWVIIEGPVAP